MKEVTVVERKPVRGAGVPWANCVERCLVEVIGGILMGQRLESICVIWVPYLRNASYEGVNKPNRSSHYVCIADEVGATQIILHNSKLVHTS